MNLKESLETINDSRIDRCKKHSLVDILMIVFFGVLCGYKSIESIHLYAELSINVLKKYLLLANGIPSADTILREITLMLQKEGFRVAMDDFGSGESSLNMLSTIPVNILKFDRSFLFANDAKTGKLDETSETFIETLVDLGKNLKKETIFEGVETEEQRDFLRKINCDQVQGFFYSKPLREEEYMEFLKNHR